MVIGIINPYFDSLSGGERYTLALASHWSKNHTVHIFWDDPSILSRASEHLHLDLSRVRVVPNIFQRGRLIEKLVKSRAYDLLFFLSDGSIPTTLAKYNILHFQVPFHPVSVSFLKMWRYNAIVCNSNFTRNNLDSRLEGKSIIIYPPVDTRATLKKMKTNTILSVGRFSNYFQTKKQEIMIDAFAVAHRQGTLKDWKLILVGGLLSSDKDYFESLARRARSFPIELVPNAPFTKLQSYYDCAKIYWHAAGFGETDPKLAEHFGISTVEAMARGCVPVVYNGGGLSEIVEEGKNGYLFASREELVSKTVDLASDSRLYRSMQKEAILRSKEFDQSKFFSAFDVLLKSITR